MLGDIDRVTKTPKQIDYYHSKIHDGDAFFTQLEGAILAAGRMDFLILLPPTRYMHLSAWSVVGDRHSLYQFYEGADITVLGVLLNVTYNRNRLAAVGFANPPLVEFYSGPTIGVGGPGIELQSAILDPLSTRQLSTSQAAQGQAEWELDRFDPPAPIYYLIRVTNLDGANPLDFGVNLEHYEEE